MRRGIRLRELSGRNRVPTWALLPGGWSSGQANLHSRCGKILSSCNRVSGRHAVSGRVLVRRRSKRQDSLCGRHICGYGRLNIGRRVLRLHCRHIFIRGVFGLYQVRPWNSRSRIGRSLLRQVRAGQVCCVHGFCVLYKLPRGQDERIWQRLGGGLLLGR